ncbi:F-box/FBD/LRR-repeat protein At1g13570-like [Argentina anserina]|uniref:F-box/FBD/LRR-repeat protein At1g13570-like n=1 Tax=Argentina anserina TaxID=57926 RepID=UPI002176770F|nr:F-box/FBD/LRR-repeat protein At1g13570-like [Potentilla anserina]
MEVELDRISNLPDELLGKILSNLRMKDGARTSVLSSKWRYKWAMIPQLVFDDGCPDDIVDRVLLSHIGPITKFVLETVNRDSEVLDRWIVPISRHPISGVMLGCHGMGQRYKMPLCFFSCQDLIHLHLSACVETPFNI